MRLCVIRPNRQCLLVCRNSSVIFHFLPKQASQKKMKIERFWINGKSLLDYILGGIGLPELNMRVTQFAINDSASGFSFSALLKLKPFAEELSV